MQRKFFYVIASMVALGFAGAASASERTWNFSQMTVDQSPTGCFSTVAGEGKPGTWKIVMDDFPLAMQPLSSNAPKTAPKSVVGVVDRDYTLLHYPMLVLGEDSYADFTFKTKLKIVDGLQEQDAGVAFRMQDEKNFYYVLVDAVAKKLTFGRFYKGVPYHAYSEERNIGKGTWHDLSIECAATKMRIDLDGQQTPWLSEPTFAAGKMAFFTQSDSSAHFTDTHINYTPKEPFAQVIVRDVMKEYPKLEGVKIYMVPPKGKDIRLVASNDEKEIGEPGGKLDADVINRGVNYCRRTKELVYVTMPLRDRNGDPVAAVQLVMKTFPGQTDENALGRATPVLKKMQLRAAVAENLF
ncbi:MAG TPA: family 16 glycoside hydrolase [Verrucomicrobiae bacterium]|nr:family 16 glycoside hydrolase [Verrucomicrobiae bacterium]